MPVKLVDPGLFKIKVILNKKYDLAIFWYMTSLTNLHNMT